jgi:hypothetical protein
MNCTGTIDVSIDGISLWQDQIATCGYQDISLPDGLGDVQFYSLACPIKSGSQVYMNMSMVFPSAAPSGDYDITLSAYVSSHSFRLVFVLFTHLSFTLAYL